MRESALYDGAVFAAVEISRARASALRCGRLGGRPEMVKVLVTVSVTVTVSPGDTVAGDTVSAAAGVSADAGVPVATTPAAASTASTPAVTMGAMVPSSSGFGGSAPN